MRKLVQAYVCGVVRFSASILWLRSSDSNIKTVRYFYCIAIAACLGISAAEALNLSCCANESVSKTNKSYAQLLERTGLPSIEEMAMRDACFVVKQIYYMKPE